jgi:hypothetical protein
MRADDRSPRGRPPAPRGLPPAVLTTAEFERWSATLDPDRRARLHAAIARVARGGPTLGRPHVDVIHGSRVHKLKEARIDRGTRVLFAFDSNRRAIMLIGGDKSGRWSRWYPASVRSAERLYLDHERNIGKEGRCLSGHAAGRTSPRERR